MIENKDSKQLGIKSVINIFDEELSQEAKNMLIKLNAEEKIINHKRRGFKRDKNLEYHFRDYKYLKEFFKDIYYKNFSIKEAGSIQEEFMLYLLHQKNTKQGTEYKNKKLKYLENVKDFMMEER